MVGASASFSLALAGVGVAVLDVRRDASAGITIFGDPTLVERFGPTE